MIFFLVCWPAGDGLLDLAFVNRDPVPTLLYHNEGGEDFSRVTTGPLMTDIGASNHLAWGDYDGLPPATCLRSMYVSPVPGRDRFLLEEEW